MWQKLDTPYIRKEQGLALLKAMATEVHEMPTRDYAYWVLLDIGAGKKVIKYVEIFEPSWVIEGIEIRVQNDVSRAPFNCPMWLLDQASYFDPNDGTQEDYDFWVKGCRKVLADTKRKERAKKRATKYIKPVAVGDVVPLVSGFKHDGKSYSHAMVLSNRPLIVKLGDNMVKIDKKQIQMKIQIPKIADGHIFMGMGSITYGSPTVLEPF